MLKCDNEFVLMYEKLVLSIVNKYANNYNREDLYQVGMKKLNEIVPKFDESLGIKFSTYAYRHILGEILDYLRKDRSVQISREIISISRKINTKKEQFYLKFGKYPSTSELSSILNISEEKIINAMNVNQNIESLDRTYDDDDNLTLQDKIYVRENICKEDLICLRDALSSLNESDRKLIYQRYFEDMTQTQIAKQMNISQVKVYRMEKKILDDLNLKMIS